MQSCGGSTGLGTLADTGRCHGVGPSESSKTALPYESKFVVYGISLGYQACKKAKQLETALDILQTDPAMCPSQIR